jgi:hypothetical protein
MSGNYDSYFLGGRGTGEAGERCDVTFKGTGLQVFRHLWFSGMGGGSAARGKWVDLWFWGMLRGDGEPMD